MWVGRRAFGRGPGTNISGFYAGRSIGTASAVTRVLGDSACDDDIAALERLCLAVERGVTADADGLDGVQPIPGRAQPGVIRLDTPLLRQVHLVLREIHRLRCLARCLPTRLVAVQIAVVARAFA